MGARTSRRHAQSIVSVGIFSGTQSQRKGNKRLGEVFGHSASTSARLCVCLAPITTMHNAHLDVSVSELQTYVTVAAELHSSKVTMSRMAVMTLTSDCKTTGTTPAHLHCTKTGKPKRGKAGAGP